MRWGRHCRQNFKYAFYIKFNISDLENIDIQSCSIVDVMKKSAIEINYNTENKV